MKITKKYAAYAEVKIHTKSIFKQFEFTGSTRQCVS